MENSLLNPQMNPMQVPGKGPPPGDNVWIEVKSGDGKSYYYHSRTRETVWNRPENALILTQEQFNASQIRHHMPPAGGPRHLWPPNPLLGPAPHMNASVPPPNFPIGGGMSVNRMPLGNVNNMPLGTGLLPPPHLHLQPPQHQQPFQHILRHNPPHNLVPNQVPTLLGNGETAKATSMLLQFVDPEIRMRASDWIEYKTADARPYYFCKKTQESVWEKPVALVELDDALEKARKNQEAAAKNGQNQSQISNSMNNQEVRGKSRDVIESDSSISNTSVKEVAKKEEPKDKSKPISSTPVSGTGWCVVWTGDMKVFFYNPTTKTSIWEKPPELKDRPDVDKLLKHPVLTDEKPVSPGKDHEKVSQDSQKRPADTSGDDAQVTPKKAKEDTVPDKESEKESDPEAIAAKKREELPIEERTRMFKEMLSEKEVSAFSTFEKELHKIVFDPRYLLLTSKERRSVFDDYVKDRAEQERLEKRAQLRKAREDFRSLLEDAKIVSRTSFNEFCLKYSKDERFKAIEKMREREAFFNDYISEIRRKEREKVIALRDQTWKDFNDLLKETHEKKPFDRNAKWLDVKDTLRSDPRYKAVDSSSEREQLFRTFITETVSAASRTAEDEEEENERQKRERIEKSLRERKREVKKELSTHLRERDKEAEKLKRADASEAFTALLMDLVKSDDYTWREARHILKKDKRMELCDCLSREDMEKLFEEHINRLVSKKKERFRECLNEIKDMSLSSNWRDVRRLVKDDPRYFKFSTSDRKCEREFREFLWDKLQAAKVEFKEFLKETKILTYKSRKLIDESDQHLQDIIAVLQNDKRYLVLDCVADERREILMAYIDELDRKGPPPPPTASEPPVVRKKEPQA